MGTLLSSKLNQWTLLVGSLPLAYMLGGGGAGGLVLDARQTQEFLLTATQSVLGFAVLLNLRFGWPQAAGLLALFATQLPFPETSARLGFSAVYVAAAVVVLVVQRRGLRPMAAYVLRSRNRPPRECGGDCV
jgi:cation:H+ antiporter